MRRRRIAHSSVFALPPPEGPSPQGPDVTPTPMPPDPPPPDPQPPGSLLATYTAPGNGWGHALLVLPEGQATDTAIIVDGQGYQTDVFSTWGDGSIKHAMLTSYIPSAGTYEITTGIDSVGPDIVPDWPMASVVLTIAGVDYTAILPHYSVSLEHHLQGPLVTEARAVVTPITAGGVSHPVLQVIYDVRTVYGNQSRIDVQVINARNVVQGSFFTYDVNIYIAGQTVFTKTAFTHLYWTAWRQVFSYYRTTVMKPDFAPFIEAGAIPQFLPTVANPTYVSTGIAFGIGMYGGCQQEMGVGGGRPDIGCQPWWVAQYLVHKTQSQYDYMIANANIAGSWYGSRIAKADGVSIPTIDEYPTWFFDYNAGTQKSAFILAPSVNFSGLHQPGGSVAFRSWELEIAHQPTLNYVPWLVTGDRWHADMMAGWANYSMLISEIGRNGTEGLVTTNQVRGTAWSLRIMGECGQWLPDSVMAAEKAYFADKAQNNIDALDAKVGGGPFNFMLPQPQNTFDVNGHYIGLTFSVWQAAYLGWVVRHLSDMGYTTTFDLIDQMVANQVLLMTSEPDFPIQGTSNGWPGISNPSNVYHTTLAACYASTLLFIQKQGFIAPWAGYYGPEVRIMLQLGVQRSDPDCQALIDYLMLQSGMTGDVNTRSGFAIDIS